MDSIGLYLSEYRDVVTKVKWGKGISNQPNDKAFIFNYPNPFNASTRILFKVPRFGSYRVEVYNILGQKVETVMNRELEKGLHQLSFTPDNLSSGIYFCCLQGKNVFQTNKMQLIK